MNKAAISDIDAGVRGQFALPKKNQVASTKAAVMHRLAPRLQPGYGSGWHHACAGLVHMTYEPAAVKATVRRIAAVAIRRADQADGIEGDVTGLLRGDARWQLRCRQHRRDARQQRPGAASAQNKHQQQNAKTLAWWVVHDQLRVQSDGTDSFNTPSCQSTCWHQNAPPDCGRFPWRGRVLHRHI